MRNRIRDLRETAGLTLERLGALAGVDRATVWRYEKGRTSLFNDSAHKFAAALGVDNPAEFLETSAPRPCQVMGEVGAGAQVFHQDDGREYVPSPADMEAPMAVRVRGTSMMPVYREGDLLFAEQRKHVANDVVGQDCIVQVADGPCLVKRVHRGSGSGLFRLFSYETQELTDDLRLTWAAPVRWVRR